MEQKGKRHLMVRTVGTEGEEDSFSQLQIQAPKNPAFAKHRSGIQLPSRGDTKQPKLPHGACKYDTASVEDLQAKGEQMEGRGGSLGHPNWHQLVGDLTLRSPLRLSLNHQLTPVSGCQNVGVSGA